MREGESKRSVSDAAVDRLVLPPIFVSVCVRLCVQVCDVYWRVNKQNKNKCCCWRWRCCWLCFWGRLATVPDTGNRKKEQPKSLFAFSYLFGLLLAFVLIAALVWRVLLAQVCASLPTLHWLWFTLVSVFMRLYQRVQAQRSEVSVRYISSRHCAIHSATSPCSDTPLITLDNPTTSTTTTKYEDNNIVAVVVDRHCYCYWRAPQESVCGAAGEMRIITICK